MNEKHRFIPGKMISMKSSFETLSEEKREGKS
jgi:hypothetical protein